MAKVSLQSIAESLGVSKGTVSLVLSGKAKGKRVSAELSEKIRRRAEEMNYHPNELARGLRTGQTRTIGVIVADISNEFFSRLTFFLQEHAQEKGYAVVITNTNESPDQLDKMVTLLINRQVDGIIMVPTDNGQPVIDRILAHKIPLVQIDRYYPEINASYVVLDNYKVSFDATRYLCSKGCRRIAMIRHKNGMTVSRERYKGYVDALQGREIYDPRLTKEIDYRTEEADIEKAIRELYNNPQGVDAIFFHSHELFIAGVKQMLRMGIRIPKEIEVLCFDKIDAFSIVHFPLTYIEQPIQQMAEKAVDILLEQINGSEAIQQCRFEGKIGMI